LVRVRAAFDDGATPPTAQDPGGVAFKVRSPGGVITAYTYGTDPEVVKAGTGSYYVDVNGNESGRWHVRYEGTGSGQAAEETSFVIEPSEFY
jgi:hypothetical protein